MANQLGSNSPAKSQREKELRMVALKAAQAKENNPSEWQKAMDEFYRRFHSLS